MDQLFKKWFEKQVLPPQEHPQGTAAEGGANTEANTRANTEAGGYRQQYDPHRRLQSAMQRFFRGYPTIFDHQDHFD